jgi:ankyrin repeat protein
MEASESSSLTLIYKEIDEWMPLSMAARYGHKVVIKLLLTTGKVDVDSKNQDGWTPLELATR